MISITNKYIFIQRRIINAIIWTIILHVLFLSLFLFAAKFEPWHPIQWLSSSFHKVLSFGTLLYLCPFSLVICCQGIICSKDLLSLGPVSQTRFSLFRNMFSIRNILLAKLYSLIGGSLIWLFLFLVEDHIIVKCGSSSFESKVCIDEKNVFLLFNGIWMGLYLFGCEYLDGPKYLMFPVVQQTKYFQVKMSLVPTLKKALFDSVLPTILCFVLYYWKGSNFMDAAIDFIPYDKKIERVPTSIFTLHLFMLTWLFSSMFIITLYSIKLIFKVFLTESKKFPIVAPHGATNSFTLYQALAVTDIPIIQYLAYFDLKTLAENEIERREQLFSLSQLGGHPYNWNAVIEEALKLVNGFTSKLKCINSDAPPLSKPVEQNIQTISSPITSFSSTHALRNMSLAQIDKTRDNTLVAPAKDETLCNLAMKHIRNVTSSISKKPGINYIFGELTSMKISYTLIQAHPVIWSVQGLSLLVTASLKEDRYGIALKDLPAIIVCLLDLKQTLEKIHKARRGTKQVPRDARMRAALKYAVNSSIYRIVIAFRQYLKDLPLSAEVQQQLQLYSLFREG